MKLTLLLEEYLDGPEVDVDLVLSEGEVVYGAITDNWPTIEPYFNETGSNCPSVLAREKQDRLMQLGKESVAALGLTCVSHIFPHTPCRSTWRLSAAYYCPSDQIHPSFPCYLQANFRPDGCSPCQLWCCPLEVALPNRIVHYHQIHSKP